MNLVKVQAKLMGNAFEFIALSENERLGKESTIKRTTGVE